MDSPSNAPRKVRFTLPEHESNFIALIKSRNSPAVQTKQLSVQLPVSVDESKVHGTCHYVNGTLNFVQDDFKTFVKQNQQKLEKHVEEPKHLRPCIKSPRKSKEVKCSSVENEASSQTKASPLPISLSKKFHYFIRSRSESRGRKKDISERNQKSSVTYSHAAFYFPDNIKANFTSSKSPRRKRFLLKTPDILSVPTFNMNDTMPIPKHIDILPEFLAMNLNDNLPDCNKRIPKVSTRIQQLPYMHQMVNNDTNFQNFTQFFERCQLLQNAANQKLPALPALPANEFKMDCDTSEHMVQKKVHDAKTFSLLSSNYRKRIMNIEKTPLVTSLIRACRNPDFEQWTKVKESICRNGISANDLNSVDKNGRTALSYICITSLTKVLDFLLQLKGIDVNKPDNDGNTPLHFAAEAGQVEIITMLITRSRSLVIDAKNNFGLTPLMKAAIQGRTECAKRLILANAWPLERDPSRSFTTEQWAQFCGHKDCADSIGKLIRNRKCLQPVLLNKEYTLKAKIESKSCSTKASNGLISKIFNNLSYFKRSKLPSESDLPDLVNSMMLEGDIATSVPIVEITPANNHHLINKYKSRYTNENLVDLTEDLQAIIPTKVSLRRKSCNQ